MVSFLQLLEMLTIYRTWHLLPSFCHLVYQQTLTCTWLILPWTLNLCISSLSFSAIESLSDVQHCTSL